MTVLMELLVFGFCSKALVNHAASPAQRWTSRDSGAPRRRRR